MTFSLTFPALSRLTQISGLQVGHLLPVLRRRSLRRRRQEAEPPHRRCRCLRCAHSDHLHVRLALLLIYTVLLPLTHRTVMSQASPQRQCAVPTEQVAVLFRGCLLAKVVSLRGEQLLRASLPRPFFRSYTADCYSAPVTGLFALTHDRNLDIIVPSSSNQPALHAYYKGLAVLVAGLVTCDVMNILTMLVLPTIAAEEEKPAAEGKVVESAV